MSNDIKNQVLKDGSIVAPWTYSTEWLNTIDNPFDPDCFMQAWGNIKWKAVRAFANIGNGKPTGHLFLDGRASLSIPMVDVSEHVLIPITESLDTGVQELVRTPR